ncbi:MAG: putative metal-binding motif-containing protein, partial [Myxococcota bacterium]|nr:putative metal-binding motif-containing protein [Myxococcota bacterium]
SVESCVQPSGYVDNMDDCNDSQALAWSDAEEICDGVDNNCSGDESDATDILNWYADIDSDGYGDPNVSVESCVQPSGYVDNMNDCNDSQALAWTGQVEVCDGVDNNCSGDETDATDILTWYADTDSDGYGDPNASVESCVQPSGYVDNTDDCNDSQILAWTGQIEVCDGVDNNCSGDESDATDILTWYADSDTDSYGDPNMSVESCVQPSGYVDNMDDCNDLDNTILLCPTDDSDGDGILASQDCNDNDALDLDCDGFPDNINCDGTSTTDQDCDGAVLGDDCDDSNPYVGDMTTDQDCDGLLSTEDCDDSDPMNTIVLFDNDGDGVTSCETDCDDNDINNTDVCSIYAGIFGSYELEHNTVDDVCNIIDWMGSAYNCVDSEVGSTCEMNAVYEITDFTIDSSCPDCEFNFDVTLTMIPEQSSLDNCPSIRYLGTNGLVTGMPPVTINRNVGYDPDFYGYNNQDNALPFGFCYSSCTGQGPFRYFNYNTGYDWYYGQTYEWSDGYWDNITEFYDFDGEPFYNSSISSVPIVSFDGQYLEFDISTHYTYMTTEIYYSIPWAQWDRYSNNSERFYIEQIGYESVDNDLDGLTELDGDCNDHDASLGNIAYDADCDGVSYQIDCDDADANLLAVSNDMDCDGALTLDDCDDNDVNSTIRAEDYDCDGVLVQNDCNDAIATMPNEDADCDGVLTVDDCDDTNPATINDMDCDGVLTVDDCDDENPNLLEVALDTNCDGVLDITEYYSGEHMTECFDVYTEYGYPTLTYDVVRTYQTFGLVPSSSMCPTCEFEFEIEAVNVPQNSYGWSYQTCTSGYGNLTFVYGYDDDYYGYGPSLIINGQLAFYDGQPATASNDCDYINNVVQSSSNEVIDGPDFCSTLSAATVSFDGTNFVYNSGTIGGSYCIYGCFYDHNAYWNNTHGNAVIFQP